MISAVDLKPGLLLGKVKCIQTSGARLTLINHFMLPFLIHLCLLHLFSTVFVSFFKKRLQSMALTGWLFTSQYKLCPPSWQHTGHRAGGAIAG